MQIYRSKHADIDLPKLDILTLLFESSWCSAQEDTVIHAFAHDPKNSITKSQARDLTRRIAYVLRHKYSIGSHGAGKDVVLSTASLSPFLPILFYGTMAAGGVYCGASTASTVSELARQIRDSGATVLLCSKEYEDVTVAAAKQCGVKLDRILVIDSSSSIRWKLLLSGHPHIDVLRSYSGRMLEWQRFATLSDLKNTTTCLLYSSGTTGLPKGVRLSHWNLVSSNILSMRVGARYVSRRIQEGHKFHWRTIGCLPMAHIAGIQQYSLNPFYMGGTVYWLEKYNFDDFIKYSRQFRTVYQFSVPPIWLQVAKSSKVKYHFDTLEVACSGAAPMGLELVKEVSRKLGKGNTFMTQTWGATETDGSITATDWDVRDETGAVGGILPNVRLRVINDEGHDVEPGGVGELLVSGPIVCQGYHNNSTATQASIIDGWYHTGDVGYIKDNLVYLVDRKKELIKYKGLQVAPAELEDLLMSHPKIADAAVVGVQSERYGTEVPKAFLVLKPETQMDVREVIEFVKTHVASHKRLRGEVEFITEIPKSASGKILRKELRKRPYVEKDLKAKL